ncbi:hypothetical protein [Geodermatophilus sp. URMC 60]
MTAPRDPSAVRPWTVWTPLGVALAVVLFLATIGSLGVGFGVLTNCTNTYGCTATGCTPCETTSAWLDAGWIGQVVLLLAGVVLVVLAARRRALRAVRLGALVLPVLGVALIVVTTALATVAI